MHLIGSPVMLTLPTDHPNFDAALELLCSLSRTPKSAILLASEFGVTVGDVLCLAKELRDAGHAVSWGHYRGGNPQFARVIACPWLGEREQLQDAYVWLSYFGASLAKECAQSYWERTR